MDVLIDPHLTTVEPYDFDADRDGKAIEITKQLADLMLKYEGMWLAAPMCGIHHRIAVIASNPVFAIVNPRIVNASQNLIALEEGGLSWPGYTIKVKRPDVIRLRFTQPNGETNTKQLSGVTARLVQQCIDVMDGKRIGYGAGKFHRDQAERRRKRYERENDAMARDLVANAYRNGSFEMAMKGLR